MSKISDVSDLSSHPDTLVDLNWLLVTASSEVKSPLLWSVLALILRWCRSHPWIHRMMRDRFQLCSTLTPILLSLPTTTHERCLKLLEALRWSVAGLRLPRLESFVLDLIPKLLEYASIMTMTLFG